jgi:hypothetical protein
MGVGWKRVNDCALCGSARCVVSCRDENFGYCFRFSKSFYVSKKDGRVIHKGGEHRKRKDLQLDLFSGFARSSSLKALSQGDILMWNSFRKGVWGKPFF